MIVCLTPQIVLYQSILNFAGAFVTVCRCACSFGIINDLIFVTFFNFLTYPFLGLKYIKEHHTGYLVCVTPLQKCCRCFCHALQICMWFWHYHHFNFYHIFGVLNLAIFWLKYYQIPLQGTICAQLLIQFYTDQFETL